LNKQHIGYGSVWGKDKRENRDTIFEFYLSDPFRKYDSRIFADFIKCSGSGFIQCQSNDILITRMLFEYANNIKTEAIIFEDSYETDLNIPGSSLIKNEMPDEEVEYRLEKNNGIVATGGYVWNYNNPFIDLYYEVREEHRNNGFGSLIVQELKKEAYRLKRVPAARCNVKNLASKRTLIKAGMRVCGYMLIGDLM
jgi:RimJ/RimL family protein N-acetyltransferase